MHVGLLILLSIFRDDWSDLSEEMRLQLSLLDSAKWWLTLTYETVITTQTSLLHPPLLPVFVSPFVTHTSSTRSTFVTPEFSVRMAASTPGLRRIKGAAHWTISGRRGRSHKTSDGQDTHRHTSHLPAHCVISRLSFPTGRYTHQNFLTANGVSSSSSRSRLHGSSPTEKGRKIACVGARYYHIEQILLSPRRIVTHI